MKTSIFYKNDKYFERLITGKGQLMCRNKLDVDGALKYYDFGFATINVDELEGFALLRIKKGNLMVELICANKGFGTPIMEEIINYANKNRNVIENIDLEALTSKTLIKWYEKFGFSGGDEFNDEYTYDFFEMRKPIFASEIEELLYTASISLDVNKTRDLFKKYSPSEDITNRVWRKFSFKIENVKDIDKVTKYFQIAKIIKQNGADLSYTHNTSDIFSASKFYNEIEYIFSRNCGQKNDTFHRELRKTVDINIEKITTSIILKCLSYE